MVDDLLAVFDLVRSWLSQITAENERLPASAAGDAAALITRLRGPLGNDAAHPVAASRTTGAPAGLDRAPEWLPQLGVDWLTELAEWLQMTGTSLRFVRYLPDEDCFFRGEDPLNLVRQVPALAHLVLLQPAEWTAREEYDEYQCRLGFVLATRAATSELEYLLRYVTDQVELADVDAAGIRRGLDPDRTETEAAGFDVGAAGVESAPLGSVLATDAVAILRAAERGLSYDDDGPARLRSIANAATAAARALKYPLAVDVSDRTAAQVAVRALLDQLEDPIKEEAAPPAATKASGGGRAEPDGGRVGTRILKVEQEQVDRMMKLVGELNVAKNGLPFLADAAEEEYGSRDLSRRIKDQYAGMHRIAEELQSAVMDVRMLPLSVSFSRFPRLVRDLGRRLGKQIDLIIEGEDTMADKDVIEALADPLVHIVRNSLDHGVEGPEDRVASGKSTKAKIQITAFADGDGVIVEVTDDGRGIDPNRIRAKAYERGLITEDQLELLSDADAVNLVFAPGFSTAEEISEVSGRGVGMDAVRASVERLGGTVVVQSKVSVGTTTRLRLPLSMAVTQVMVVSVAGQRFGVPVDAVVETVRVSANEIDRIVDQRVVVLRDELVPVLDLAEVLRMPRPEAQAAECPILVTSINGAKIGLLVERFHREVDLIVKPLEGLLAEISEFTGTALLGDGLVLLIINMKEVFRLAAGAG